MTDLSQLSYLSEKDQYGATSKICATGPHLLFCKQTTFHQWTEVPTTEQGLDRLIRISTKWNQPFSMRNKNVKMKRSEHHVRVCVYVFMCVCVCVQVCSVCNDCHRFCSVSSQGQYVLYPHKLKCKENKWSKNWLYHGQTKLDNVQPLATENDKN